MNRQQRRLVEKQRKQLTKVVFKETLKEYKEKGITPEMVNAYNMFFKQEDGAEIIDPMVPEDEIKDYYKLK